ITRSHIQFCGFTIRLFDKLIYIIKTSIFMPLKRYR
ncbi:hypothetical protein ECEC1862_2936, partial [Escherichia coli EC1862]